MDALRRTRGCRRELPAHRTCIRNAAKLRGGQVGKKESMRPRQGTSNAFDPVCGSLVLAADAQRPGVRAAEKADGYLHSPLDAVAQERFGIIVA